MRIMTCRFAGIYSGRSKCDREMTVDQKQRHILLVEDDSSTRRAMESILVASDWIVVSVSTVEAAMQNLRGKEWVLLDLMLPDGEGVTVFEYIRANELEIKVAILTASFAGNRRDRATALSPEIIMTKPIDVETLFARMKDL